MPEAQQQQDKGADAAAAAAAAAAKQNGGDKQSGADKQQRETWASKTFVKPELKAHAILSRFQHRARFPACFSGRGLLSRAAQSASRPSGKIP